jgi:hypothetical protein
MNAKPSTAKATEVRERTAALARVQRPSLMEFLLDAFWTLPALPAAVVKDANVRAYYHGDDGWVLPVDSLGRKGAESVADEKAARSTAESVRLWIQKNLEDVVNIENVAVVIEVVEDEHAVCIYRKA